MQNCASSAQSPHIDVQKKCATGVQQKQTELPPDLAAVLAALTTRWPEMREGEKAAIKALAGVKA